MTPEEITAALENFYGTEGYHRWSILYPRFVLTDGAQYLAANCGAFWLMDLIGSYQRRLLGRGEFFQTWRLTVKGRSAVATCDDGNGRKLASQKIGYTDFPLGEIKLYAVFDGSTLVIMLPTEY